MKGLFGISYLISCKKQVRKHSLWAHKFCWGREVSLKKPACPCVMTPRTKELLQPDELGPALEVLEGQAAAVPLQHSQADV